MGFKVNPIESGSRKFPITAFPGARFQLIMSGSQTDYRYRLVSNPGGGVSIDQNGMVKLNSKPSGNVTARAILIRDERVKFDYTFNPTTVWANPVKDFFNTRRIALQQCDINNLLSYKVLTNAPITHGLNHGMVINNGFTRSIGERLFPEWGYTLRQSYPDLNWADRDNDRYWTKNYYDQSDYGNVIDVNAGYGHVGVDCDLGGCSYFLVCQ
ncbi:hypothetical protein A9G25_07230 [Gilliamella sp. Bif1-4]|nr:hypothetical protein A9G25_07230 [Gilliamella apicola]